MADPYDFPDTRPAKPPAISIMTIIGVAFLLFTVYQVSVTIAESVDSAEEMTVQTGDTIRYDYTARFPDGTLYETTQLSVAEAAGPDYALQPATFYQPDTATVDLERPGLGWGAEAEQRLIGAHVGETVRFTVPTEHGVGDWRPLVPDTDGAIPLETPPQPYSRMIFLQEPTAAQAEGNSGTPQFNLTEFESRYGGIETGMEYNRGTTIPPSWDIVFEDVNRDNRSVLIRDTVQDGQYFDVPEMPGGIRVLLVDNESQLVFRYELDEGSTFVVEPNSELNRARWSPGSYLVQDVNETHMVLLYNPIQQPDHVGQHLLVELTILSKSDTANQTDGRAGSAELPAN